MDTSEQVVVDARWEEIRLGRAVREHLAEADVSQLGNDALGSVAVALEVARASHVRVGVADAGVALAGQHVLHSARRKPRAQNERRGFVVCHAWEAPQSAADADARRLASGSEAWYAVEVAVV